jgi:hypothetical protein
MAMHFKLYRDAAELPVGARIRLSLNLRHNDAVDDLTSPRECLEALVAHLNEMLMGEAEPSAGHVTEVAELASELAHRCENMNAEGDRGRPRRDDDDGEIPPAGMHTRGLWPLQGVTVSHITK